MSSPIGPATTSGRVLRTPRGAEFDLPLFLPVFQPGSAFVPDPEQQRVYAVEGCIVNAFFLYKHRPLREQFEAGLTLRQHVGVEGVLATDSGAFQGFTRTLYLSNKQIVRFQDAIGADIVSPLDLVTPPGDKRSVAEAKLASTNARIREAMPLVQNGLLAGVRTRQLRLRDAALVARRGDEVERRDDVGADGILELHDLLVRQVQGARETLERAGVGRQHALDADVLA